MRPDRPGARAGSPCAGRLDAELTGILVGSRSGLPDFDPMRGVYLTEIDQAELVERNLQFVPNRTLLTSAHLQASNKMGPSPGSGCGT